MLTKTRLTAGFLSRPTYEPEAEKSLLAELASEKSQRVQLEAENKYLKEQLGKLREKQTVNVRADDFSEKPIEYTVVKEIFIKEDGTDGEERH